MNEKEAKTPIVFQQYGNKDKVNESDDLNPFIKKCRVSLMSSPKRIGSSVSNNEFVNRRHRAYSFLDERIPEVKVSSATKRKEKYRKLIKKLK